MSNGILTVNGNAQDTNSVGVRMQSFIQEDQFRRPFSRVERWTIVGAVLSDGSSGALQTKIDQINALYQSGGAHYGDATYTANGHTHTLSNSGSFSGVRVRAFGWNSGPWKMNTELSNRRSYYAVLQAEYRYNTDVAAYREEIIEIGTGGFRFRFMPSLTGLPQYQTLQLATTVRYAQRGILVRRSVVPTPNSPVFPALNTHADQQRIALFSPSVLTKNGTSQNNEMYGVSWAYFAEASSPLTFSPSVVPDI